MPEQKLNETFTESVCRKVKSIVRNRVGKGFRVERTAYLFSGKIRLYEIAVWRTLYVVFKQYQQKKAKQNKARFLAKFTHIKRGKGKV